MKRQNQNISKHKNGKYDVYGFNVGANLCVRPKNKITFKIKFYVKTISKHKNGGYDVYGYKKPLLLGEVIKKN